MPDVTHAMRQVRAYVDRSRLLGFGDNESSAQVYVHVHLTTETRGFPISVLEFLGKYTMSYAGIMTYRRDLLATTRIYATHLTEEHKKIMRRLWYWRGNGQQQGNTHIIRHSCVGQHVGLAATRKQQHDRVVWKLDEHLRTGEWPGREPSGVQRVYEYEARN